MSMYHLSKERQRYMALRAVSFFIYFYGFLPYMVSTYLGITSFLEATLHKNYSTKKSFYFF